MEAVTRSGSAGLLLAGYLFAVGQRRAHRRPPAAGPGQRHRAAVLGGQPRADRAGRGDHADPHPPPARAARCRGRRLPAGPRLLRRALAARVERAERSGLGDRWLVLLPRLDPRNRGRAGHRPGRLRRSCAPGDWPPSADRLRRSPRASAEPVAVHHPAGAAGATRPPSRRWSRPRSGRRPRPVWSRPSARHPASAGAALVAVDVPMARRPRHDQRRDPGRRRRVEADRHAVTAGCGTRPAAPGRRLRARAGGHAGSPTPG